jgi:membrane fusion protein
MFKRHLTPDQPMDSAILLAQPVMHGILSIAFFVVFFIALIVLFFGSYSRQESVRGEVVAKDMATTLVTEYPGSVFNLLVQQGDMVQAGQIVAEIRVSRVIAASGDRAALGLSRMIETRANLIAQRLEMEASVNDLRRLRTQLPVVANSSASSIDKLRAAAEAQKRMAEDRLNVISNLAKRGFATQTAVDEARTTLLSVEQSLANASYTQSELQRTQDEREYTISNQYRSLQQSLFGVENQVLEVESKINEMEAQEFIKVAATTSGQVSALSVRNGQRVETGDPLMSIANPEAELLIALKVPSSAIGFLEKGQKAILKYDAFPFQTFGAKRGIIMSVSTAATAKTESETPTSEVEAAYIVDVRPQEMAITARGERRPLKIGMKVTAEIQLEKRKLIEWLLEPLYSISGRV